MNANDYLSIAEILNNCPLCNSGKIGDEEGSLSVSGNTLIRTCKCGFEAEIKVKR